MLDLLHRISGTIRMETQSNAELEAMDSTSDGTCDPFDTTVTESVQELSAQSETTV